MTSYYHLVSIRKLFAVLIAVAMSFTPALQGASSAFAAVPDHHSQMMEKGHCDPASETDEDEPVDMACCGAMCMAVAIAPPSPRMVEPLIGSVPAASLQEFQTGILAEIATPPPRVA